MVNTVTPKGYLLSAHGLSHCKVFFDLAEAKKALEIAMKNREPDEQWPVLYEYEVERHAHTATKYKVVVFTE